jgi:hypothetical protein
VNELGNTLGHGDNIGNGMWSSWKKKGELVGGDCRPEAFQGASQNQDLEPTRPPVRTEAVFLVGLSHSPVSFMAS